MSVNKTAEQCFREAENTGRLLLSQKNLRDFPDVVDDCELIDVIEAGKMPFLVSCDAGTVFVFLLALLKDVNLANY